MLGLGIGLARRRASGPIVPPPIPSNQYVALDGDSRTLSSGFTNLDGYAAWALAFADHRCDLIATPLENFAVGGQNSGNILARVPATAAATAGTVIALFCRNDVSAGLTVQQTIDNWTAWLNAVARDANKVVVLCNDLPDSGFVGSQITDHLARKAWLEDPARKVTWPNIYQIDTFNAMLKSGTQCTWKDDYSFDGTHMFPKGHRALGEFIGSKLKLLFPLATWPSLINLPTSAADAYNASTNPFGYLNVNPLMIGNAGTKSGTTIYTGLVPDNWDITSAFTGLTCACSQGTDSDGFAQLIMHISGTVAGASNAVLTLRQITGAVANVNAGDKLRVAGRIIVDAGAVGLRGIGVNSFATGNAGAGAISFTNLAFNGNSLSTVHDGSAIDYKIAAPYVTAPSTWVTDTARGIRAQASFNLLNGGGAIDFTTRVSRLHMRKVA